MTLRPTFASGLPLMPLFLYCLLPRLLDAFFGSIVLFTYTLPNAGQAGMGQTSRADGYETLKAPIATRRTGHVVRHAPAALCPVSQYAYWCFRINPELANICCPSSV